MASPPTALLLSRIRPARRLRGWVGALAVLLGLLAAGCAANPTPYQPLSGGEGYEETHLQQDVYRVTYHANRFTPEQRVIDYLFLRSAELTRQQGYTHFVVEERREGQAANGDSGPRVSLGLGFGTGGGGSFFGLGVGTSTRPAGGGTGLLAAFRIRLLTAEEARSRENAYDAAEVLANLPGRLEADQAGQS